MGCHSKEQRNEFVQRIINAVQRAPEGVTMVLVLRDPDSNNTMIHAHVEGDDYDGASISALEYAKYMILSDPGGEGIDEEDDGSEDWPDDTDDEDETPEGAGDSVDRDPKH
jgi:hypothetical protein